MQGTHLLRTFFEDDGSRLGIKSRCKIWSGCRLGDIMVPQKSSYDSPVTALVRSSRLSFLFRRCRARSRPQSSRLSFLSPPLFSTMALVLRRGLRHASKTLNVSISIRQYTSSTSKSLPAQKVPRVEPFNRLPPILVSLHEAKARKGTILLYASVWSF